MMMMMMMAKDEWIRAAMTDDSMVAELLLRLKQSHASQSVKSSPPVIFPPSRWGLRQQRSRSVLRCDAVAVVSSRKDAEPTTRCSPTTPLSWSGGTGSPSTTADGFEASSRLNNSSPAARSKGVVANEAASNLNRKSRKRKTFAELKEEENILSKERIYLNKELATLRATFKEQTSRNECLKRLKVEYNLHSTRKTTAAFNEHKNAYSNYAHQMEAATLNQAPLRLPTHVPSDKVIQPDSFKVQKSVATQERHFILPDLNSTPSENDSCSETLYGMS